MRNYFKIFTVLSLLFCFIITFPDVSLAESRIGENTSFDKAYDFSLGNNEIINLDSISDQDWFKVEVDREGALYVGLKRLSNDDTLYFDIDIFKQEDLSKINSFNPDSQLFSRQNVYMGYEEKFSYKLSPGTYYIRIQGSDTHSIEDYRFALDDIQLSINLLEDDQFENNDSHSNAVFYDLNTSSQVTLNAINDQDWFKVEVDREGALYLDLKRLNNDDTLYFDLDIFKQEDLSKINSFNPDSQLFSRQNVYMGYEEKFSYKLTPGTYYIRIQGSDTHSIEDYRFALDDIQLSINLLEDDQFENNDSHDNAVFYDLNTSSQVTLNAINDQDWFKVEVNEEGNLYINLKRLNNDDTLYFDLDIFKQEDLSKINSFNPDSQLFSRQNVYMGYEEDLSYKLTPGTYYIRIQGSDTHSIEDYRFALDEVELSMYMNTCKDLWNSMDFKKDISTDKKWNIAFSKAVDESSIAGNILVKNRRTNEEVPVKISLSDDKKTVTITPVENYEKNTLYSIYILDTLKSENKSENLSKSVFMNFKTQQ